MKCKLINRAALVLLTGMLITILCACGCKHEWTPATCTSPKTCVKCGATEGSALGHNIVKDDGIEATLLKEGLTEGSHCDRCGEVLSQQITIPRKIDALIEDIKTNPDKVTDKTYYVKNYHLVDFMKEKDFIESSYSEATDSAIVFEYDSKTDDLIASIWFISKTDIMTTDLLSVYIDGCIPMSTYDYYYSFTYNDGNASYNDAIAGAFSADKASTYDSFEFSKYKAGSYGFDYVCDRYKKSAASLTKQLIIAMDNFFAYKGFDLKASDFNLK